MPIRHVGVIIMMAPTPVFRSSPMLPPSAWIAAMILSLSHPLSSAESFASSSTNNLALKSTPQEITLSKNDKKVLGYLLKKPADSPSSSPSASYFHPLTTPSGVVLTDVGPDDHPHHRGAFLAWLQVATADNSGDFWGWGGNGPIDDRLIMARHTGTVSTRAEEASFTVTNDWKAGENVLLEETLKTTVHLKKEAIIHDLSYQFSARSEVKLGQHAFSGFTVRTRKDAPITVMDPDGEVKRPAPSHLKPDTDWTDRPWYAFELTLPSGQKAGVAVINHPKNPPTLWHNVAKIGMINPCILAPGPVSISANQPLVLRYRVVTYDGNTPISWLDELAQDFHECSP